jgi:hypothetical protein
LDPTFTRLPISTGKELHEISLLSPAELQSLKDRRQDAFASWFEAVGQTVPDTIDFPLESLPLASEAWPEVATPPTDDDRLDGSFPREIIIPPTIAAPDWLLHHALVGKYFDIRVREASKIYNGRYDDSVGVIEELPVIKRGMRGSVKVKIGIAMATRRFIKVTSVFPLHTNKFEGVVSRDDARPILEVMGVYVVVVGPDDAGSLAHIGKMGFVVRGGVSIDGVLHCFPISSLCRSDPYPKM